MLKRSSVEVLGIWLVAVYLNGEYRGASDIGKLMHDFNCTEADDMYLQLMAERTRYLKENPKGVSEMCKVIEDMRKEERIEERIEIAKNMLLDGMLSLEKIAEYARLSLDDVRKLKAGVVYADLLEAQTDRLNGYQGRNARDVLRDMEEAIAEVEAGE